jgi:hypothetical protein
MRCDRDSFVLPLALAAARRRTPRHLRKTREVENNYVAETPVSRRKRSRNQKRPGAPTGNRNAVTHGAFTADRRAMRAKIWKLCRSARILLQLRKLAVTMRDSAP